MPLTQCTLQVCTCDDAAVSTNIGYVSDMEIAIIITYNTVRYFKFQQINVQPVRLTLK
jgi:hypothetical protein